MDVAQAVSTKALDCVELRRLNAYWRAANYISVGQIYLCDNPLLREKLQPAHLKPHAIGQWGTTPEQNFIYAHLNRIIRRHGLDLIHVSGLGQESPALVANAYLEGSTSEIHPPLSQDSAGMKQLFARFSGSGMPCNRETSARGSIDAGGALGRSHAHAFSSALDNPEVIMACVVGDGDAATGPLATAWQANRLLDAATDGAVLPILHLNGGEIGHATLPARIRHDELEQFCLGYGWIPLFVEGGEPRDMHQQMAAALDQAVGWIHANQARARNVTGVAHPLWPMIVLRSPKGWTVPASGNGACPIPVDAARHDHSARLEQWMKSYRPWELFDASGRLVPELARLAPIGSRRLGARGHVGTRHERRVERWEYSDPPLQSA